MQKGLDVASGRRVLEQAPAQFRAVEPSSVIEDVAAQRVDQRTERGPAGLHDFACDHVGVEHGRAARGEEVCDRRLAARDTAGEADAQHRGQRRPAKPR